MLPLGLASALPNTLTQSTLTTWLATLSVNVKTISLFAMVGMPYTLKFLWAPLIDRYPLPFLGRRRGWMVVFLLASLLGLWALAGQDPAAHPGTVAALALAIGFVGASFDIANDAYRTDAVSADERASAMAVYIAGYRAALLLSGSVALVLVTFVSWRVVYLGLSSLLVVGLAATFAAPEPANQEAPPRSLLDAVVHPLVEFFRRRGAVLVVVFVVLYTIGDMMMMQLLTTFLIRAVRFTTAEIGTINKLTITVATVAGSFVGGGLVVKLGMRWSLLLFGALSGVANLLYLLLLQFGKSYVWLVVAVGGDQFCGGLRNVALNAFVMAMCDRRYSATQYALLSSATTVLGRVLASSSGFIVERDGWPALFIVTAAAALPGLVALLAIPRDVMARADATSADTARAS